MEVCGSILLHYLKRLARDLPLFDKQNIEHLFCRVERQGARRHQHESYIKGNKEKTRPKEDD